MPPDRPSPTTTTSGTRLWVFGLFGVAVVAGIIAYAIYARGKVRQEAAAAVPIDVSTDSVLLASVSRQPHLLFRNTALGPAYGTIAVVALANPNGTRIATSLRGERVYGAANGSGFYLAANRKAFTTYSAVGFDSEFKSGYSFKLAGAPSRTRTSPDGRLAASTVFVSGDSYNSGGFSTRTTLYDLRGSSVIADLEGFSVTKDGQLFKQPDFNFWGVTFARDGDLFYATLASGKIPYLIEGHISRREAHVIRAGVECPSLSADGTRIVFKSRASSNGRLGWQLHVFELQSKKEIVLAETRSVDDQAEWLDDASVLYALPREGGHSDIWQVSADGTGTPQLLVSDAASPCVIKP